ncbi:MAG: prepilin-type N-terminal cleavage/methylation domain-containing protein [Fimbriimonadaceae bacterium]|nr:prepilin-type N-terminal cleavage/methylation domain-containing protein [Fimbriimonadaceae bacterium]
MKHSLKAFTLIELLVVIAIIAILAAILFPVFAQAKNAAKKAGDLSNQKQIGLGVVMYASDYDDNFPRSNYFGQQWEQIQWTATVHPYIKSGRLNGPTNAGGGIFQTPAHNAPLAYLLHGRISPNDADWGTGFNVADPKPSVSQTQIPNVAGTMLLTTVGTPYNGYPASSMAEAWWFWSGEMGSYNPTTKACEGLYSNWPPKITGVNAGFRCYNSDGPDPVGGRDWLSGSMIRFRYNDGANLAFTDGHAKYQTAPQFNWCTQIAIPGVARFATNDPADAGNYDPTNLFTPGNVCGDYIDAL